ncbi:MAG: release factor glutamine methyltransferase [Enterobacterales bacterium]|jgi:release factor glutamine methyltransferase
MANIEQTKQVTYQQWLDKTILAFAERSDSPAVDARVLLCHCLDKPLSYLLTWPERFIDDELLIQVNKLKERRLDGEPIAYITGVREFWSLNFKVTPAVLIPRPETELMVEWALDCIEKSVNKQFKILELGTGSGAISIALAKEHPELSFLATDFSEAALKIAKENAELNNCNNILFKQGSWFDCINDQRFDLILSNPPYIDKNDAHLSRGDLIFEPATALVADKEGLADLEQIISDAKHYLNKAGCLGLEHGFEQGSLVLNLMNKHGYSSANTLKDLANLDRLSICSAGLCAVDNAGDENGR